MVRNPFPYARKAKGTIDCHYKRRKAQSITAGAFIKKYKLVSAGSLAFG